MDMTTKEFEQPAEDVREVRLTAGLAPEDVEIILDMAATSGQFSSEALMGAEDMAWDTAYGQGTEMHTFLKATVSEPGETRTIGFICFGPIANWPNEYEMYGIAVDPEFRRMGIGTALVTEMKRQVSCVGGRRIFLEASMERASEGARNFCEANEFNQEHRYCKQFIPNQGGVVYSFLIDVDDDDKQYQ